MRRSARVVLFGIVTALMLLLAPRAVFAQTVAELAEQLRSNDDYRVRTQAALALGATADDAAVAPLCDGLADANVTVRVAVAAALGKLGKQDGIECLTKAEATETQASVKTQIQKSIALLKAGGSGAPPPPGPDTKFYVAIQITNKSGRPNEEIEALVRPAMQAKILGKAGFAVAPKAETVAQGKSIVSGKKLKGFFLIATVEAPVYKDGNLQQIVRVSMWTYPDKALQGEFSPKLTQSGTPSQDTKSENALMKMCVENAIDNFHKVVASL